MSIQELVLKTTTIEEAIELLKTNYNVIIGNHMSKLLLKNNVQERQFVLPS